MTLVTFSPMSEFVECGDLSPHGSESGDKFAEVYICRAER